MKPKSVPEHIASYRYESWQIEMLIAGGILYGLFTSDSILRQFFYETFPLVDISTNLIILLFGSFILTKVLLIGFSANLLLRAIWLAYLGLGFWFPNDVNYKKVRGSEAYKDALKAEPTASDRLLVLEKWCNLSYSFAVLIGFIVLSLLLSVSVVIWLLDSITLSSSLANDPRFIYILAFVLLLVQLGVLDIFLLRKQKEGSSSNRFRRGVVKFFRVLTLSFLTRREFLVLRTNTKRWILNSFIVLYVVIAVVASARSIGEFYTMNASFKYTFFDHRENYEVPGSARMIAAHYADNFSENSKGKSLYGTIQSEVIKEDAIELFLVAWSDFDYYLEDRFEKYGIAIETPNLDGSEAYAAFYKENGEKWNTAINDLFTVKIGKIYYRNLQWKRYKHPKTNEEGFVTFINVSDLPKKEHRLEVTAKFKFNNGFIRENNWLTLPFWKE